MRPARGRALERVLPDWDGGQAPIVALYPSAITCRKTRVLLDQLAAHIAAVMNAGPEANSECPVSTPEAEGRCNRFNVADRR
jgi:hypothetical protein